MVQFIEPESDTKEERVIDVKSLRGTMRAYSAKLVEMKTAARKEWKGVCDRCAKRDYEQGKMKDDWREYAGQLTYVKTHDARNPKTQKFLGIQMDYVCPSGHGVCISITGDDYNEYKEFTCVGEIMGQCPDTTKADATKAYRINGGDVLLAVSSIQAGTPSKPSAAKAVPPVEVVKSAPDQS